MLNVVVAALFAANTATMLAQEPAPTPAPLKLRIVVSETSTNEFETRQLIDAVTVLLTAKMPDATLDDGARLSLLVAPGCLDDLLGGRYACTVNAQLVVTIWGTDGPSRPFGQVAVLTLWEYRWLETGPKGTALSSLRRSLDEALDGLVAGWRRLPASYRTCWADFLSDPIEESSWMRSGGWFELWKSASDPARLRDDHTDESLAAGVGVLTLASLSLYGPCGYAGYTER